MMHRVRWSEWQSAAIFMAIGLALAKPGETMSEPMFRALLAVMPEPMWAIALFAIGAIRACALIINGRSPKGSPVARASCAAVSAAIFAGLAAGFGAYAPHGWWAASVYLVLAAFEIATVYRATGELRSAVARHTA